MSKAEADTIVPTTSNSEEESDGDIVDELDVDTASSADSESVALTDIAIFVASAVNDDSADIAETANPADSVPEAVSCFGIMTAT